MSLFSEALDAVRAVTLLDPTRVTAGDESPLLADLAPAVVVTDGDLLREPRHFPSGGTEGRSAAVVELWVPVSDNPAWYTETFQPLAEAVRDALAALLTGGAAPVRRLTISRARRAYLANTSVPVYSRLTHTLTEEVY